MPAKSYGQKWIRITPLFINDLRKFFPQVIDFKQQQIVFLCVIVDYITNSMLAGWGDPSRFQSAGRAS
jgi:hypothetical protein